MVKTYAEQFAELSSDIKWKIRRLEGDEPMVAKYYLINVAIGKDDKRELTIYMSKGIPESQRETEGALLSFDFTLPVSEKVKKLFGAETALPAGPAQFTLRKTGVGTNDYGTVAGLMREDRLMPWTTEVGRMADHVEKGAAKKYANLLNYWQHMVPLVFKAMADGGVELHSYYQLSAESETDVSNPGLLSSSSSYRSPQLSSATPFSSEPKSRSRSGSGSKKRTQTRRRKHRKSQTPQL